MAPSGPFRSRLPVRAAVGPAGPTRVALRVRGGMPAGIEAGAVQPQVSVWCVTRARMAANLGRTRPRIGVHHRGPTQITLRPSGHQAKRCGQRPRSITCPMGPVLVLCNSVEIAGSIRGIPCNSPSPPPSTFGSSNWR